MSQEKEKWRLKRKKARRREGGKASTWFLSFACLLACLLACFPKMNMAKIVFSGLVSNVTGKLGGDIMRKGRSGVTLMDGYKPSGMGSSRQRIHRGRINNYSGQWYSLTSLQKNLWNKYASLSSGVMAGFDAYIKLNIRLASADHDDLTSITAPPASPSTPVHIEGFEVFT